MLHGVLRHIAAGFLPFLIFSLAIESYWISVAINFCLLGGASYFLILNALLIASTVRKRIAIDPTFYEAYGVCGISVIAVALAYKIADPSMRSEEHTSELQSLMRISYAVFCLKKKKTQTTTQQTVNINSNKT